MRQEGQQVTSWYQSQNIYRACSLPIYSRASAPLVLLACVFAQRIHLESVPCAFLHHIYLYTSWHLLSVMLYLFISFVVLNVLYTLSSEHCRYSDCPAAHAPDWQPHTLLGLYIYVFMYGQHIQQSRNQLDRATNPTGGQLNKDFFFPLSPFAPENSVSRDGFGRPVPCKPAHSPHSG